MKYEMLPDTGKSTRHEVLNLVRNHSKSLNKTSSDDDGSSNVEVDPRFWRYIFDSYFICAGESKYNEEDDLMFFVHKMDLAGHNFSTNLEIKSPFFVRRWAPELDAVINESNDIDWRSSFFLNLIAHTQYSVTVAICSHDVLQNNQSGQETPLLPVYKVVKRVYASPSRVSFHSNSVKAMKTTPSYPEICFSLNDFDSTFDSMVLTETNHCFCVLLNAHVKKVFHPQEMGSSSFCNISSKFDFLTGSAKDTKITIFSGFVTYQMVREAYNAGISPIGSIFSFGNLASRSNIILMKGPGGRGIVEVYVSGITDQSQLDENNRGIGIVKMARQAVSVAAKYAYSAIGMKGNDDDDEMLPPIKCSLMSISLPWEEIAHNLLFKARNIIHTKLNSKG